jgi:hypothetical protein
VSVVEPIGIKRRLLGQKFIWGKAAPVSDDGQEFQDWRDFVEWELERRQKEKEGETVREGVDAVFICVQDQMHKEVVLGIAPLGYISCVRSRLLLR